MTALEDELEEYLRTHREHLTADEIKDLEESIRHLRNLPGVRFHNPDKFDAKDMTPVGQDKPVDWNSGKKKD